MGPSRYPTPTLNQLLQPGSGGLVQRYPYSDYPRQQPPTTQGAGWPRNFNPAGFKPPTNTTQGGPPRPGYPDPAGYAYGPPSGLHPFAATIFIGTLFWSTTD